MDNEKVALTKSDAIQHFFTLISEFRNIKTDDLEHKWQQKCQSIIKLCHALIKYLPFFDTNHRFCATIYRKSLDWAQDLRTIRLEQDVLRVCALDWILRVNDKYSLVVFDV